MLALYILVILILVLLSFAHIRMGKLKLTPAITRVVIIAGALLTLYLYYYSINAIDSNNYQASFGYLGTVTYTSDIAYFGLARIVKDVWGDYQVLRLIVGIIHIVPILLLMINKKETINVPFFLLLTMLFPYFQNMVALKNTIAGSITVVAFMLYFKMPKKGISIPLTYALLGAASMFHDSTIIYVLIFSLMLVLKKIADLRKNYYILFGIIFIMFVIIRSGIASNLLNRLAGDTNQMYISRIGNIGYGFLIISAMQIVIFYLVFNTIKQAEILDGSSRYYNDIMLLFYSTLVLIPLYSINVLFFRLFRNIMIFGYVIVSENMKLNRTCKTRAILMALMAIVLMFFDANGIGSIQSIFTMSAL